MSVITDDYVTFCEGLRRLCGIDLTQYKRPQMERRLRSFFERRGLYNLVDALQTLKPGSTELDQLLDRVTINVSQLWRHPEQWRWLQSDVLGQLTRNGGLRAWSAGCSYGAEAYTLAAVCRETIPHARVQILGTDIDRRMVARASEGVFTEEDARTAPPASMDRFFERIHGGWRGKPELRSMVQTRPLNLATPFPLMGPFDVVFLRNVLIYFDTPTKRRILDGVRRVLSPGGLQILGAAETLLAAE